MRLPRRARRPGAGGADLPRLLLHAGARAGRRPLVGDGGGLPGRWCARGPQPAPAVRAGPPLVGRGRERAQLAAAWRSTEAGQRAAGAGERRGRGREDPAGRGVPRVVRARSGADVAEARCYAAEGALAYAPVVSWLRSEALRTRLPRLDRARLTELARLLPELLVETPDLAPPDPLPESEQRRRLFDAVAAVGLRGRRSRCCWSWTTSSTLTGRRASSCTTSCGCSPAARLLVVATARREDVDGDHPLHDLLAGVRARERLAEIELDAAGPRARPRSSPRRSPAPALADRDARTLRRDRGQPAVRRRGAARGLGAGQLAEPARAVGDRGAAVAAQRAGQGPGRAWRRRSGASSAPTCWPRPPTPTRTSWWGAWTSCGAGGSSGSAAKAPSGSTLRLQPRQDPPGRLPRRRPGAPAPPAPADRGRAGADPSERPGCR